MANTDQLACTYSALILADDDITITAVKSLGKKKLKIIFTHEVASEKMNTILKAANVQVEPIWPTLFARALTGVNVRELITKVGGSVGPAAASTAVAAPAAESKKEEKKEEKKKEEEKEEEEDEDMGFGLFD